MEPQSPLASPTPENGQAHFNGGEVFSGGNRVEQPVAPEQNERHETREQFVGGPSDPAPVQPVALPALPPLPQVQQPAQVVADDPAGMPVIAADEDLIEKEWVEKAKRVVAETRHDPYLQGKEVGRLQADYLQKRYGKTVNLPPEGA